MLIVELCTHNFQMRKPQSSSIALRPETKPCFPSVCRVICLCAQFEAVLQHGLRKNRGLALTAAALKQAAGFSSKAEAGTVLSWLCVWLYGLLNSGLKVKIGGSYLILASSVYPGKWRPEEDNLATAGGSRCVSGEH